MARTLEHVIDEAEFERHHSKQVSHRSQKDVFFVWIVLVLIAVVGGHFALNMSGGGMTGYVTASQDPAENMTIMMQALFVFFVAVFIVAVVHFGIAGKDY